MNIDDKLAHITEKQMRVDNWPEVIEYCVQNWYYEILDLNRDQLLLGRNTDGELLSPTYQNDPYFRTSAQAQSYARFKRALERFHRMRLTFPLNYPDKPADTPNLIIRGNFQDGMYIKFDAESFTIGSRPLAPMTITDAADIERKYNRKVFGLAPLSVEFWWNHRLRQELSDYINFRKDYYV